MRRTRHTLAAAALALSTGCSLVLDDPSPFLALDPEAGLDQAVAGDADPEVDQAPQPRLDLAMLDQAPPQIDLAPPPLDQAVVDQAVPVDQGPPVDMAPVCTDEVCDGRDNDCDGQVDEHFPGQCEPCGVPARLGLCTQGARFCVQGGVQCVSWLPDPADVVDCDLHDNDCDGQIDEFDERNAPRSAVAEQVVAVCGQPDSVVGLPGDGCGVNPRVVGCAPAHACVPTGCLVGCWDDLRTLQPTCDAACGQADPAENSACIDQVTQCHAVVRADFEACIAACPAGTATRWSCQNSDLGPQCTAVDCPEGTRPDGRECVAL